MYFPPGKRGEKTLLKSVFFVFSLAQSTKHFFGLTLKLKKLLFGTELPPQKM